MRKRQCVKKWLIAILLILFFMFTWELYIKAYQLENSFSKVNENSKHFIEKSFTGEKYRNASYSNKTVSTDGFAHLREIVTRKPQKNPSISKCGYDFCTKIRKDFINIHLVPHSHDDPGYIKSIDEYFYGLRNDIQNVTISKILDSVILQLIVNKDRKFVYSEIVYFSKWWKLQNESTRENVRHLVQNGRFEFINGGWCVHDEATTNYADIIDQMSLGLGFLEETFGECGRPKVAFQADTFGHSREQARLSSMMGFDALFLGRADKEDIERRKKMLEMEMIWSASDLKGKHPSIFTGIMYNNFDPPPGFCFDNMCGPFSRFTKPINDDINSDDYDVEERVNAFLEYCMKQSNAYKTNNIAVYMGTDFTYQYAEVWFNSMDKLIKHINKRKKYGSPFNIFYSTPACYAKALNEAQLTWPTKKDDFFPYHWKFPIYWTGYYTSRPALKYMIRQGSSILQACKQMASILQSKGLENTGNLSIMREAMAVLQHHDGITGTHNQRVSDDYARMLQKGVEECTKTTNSYYQSELPRHEDVKKFQFSVNYCHLLNMSQCEVTERKGKTFVVNIYNPLGQHINKYIRVPVTQKHNKKRYTFRVIDSNGQIVPSQLMPLASFVASMPGRNSSANTELIFLANKVPPLGSKSYFVEASLSREKMDSSISVSVWNSWNSSNLHSELKISNEKLSVVVCKETGLINAVTILGKKKIPLDQQFYWYNGNGKNGSLDNKSSSGMYVFNPVKNSAFHIKTGTKHFNVYKGYLVEEIHQTVNDYIGQIIRLYKGQNYIEFDWVIGPVPIEDKIGKEIITRYSTDFESNGIFYTDANGRQSVLRARDQRKTYNLDENDPVAANYYPITSHIFMTDLKSGYRMNVLTDRAEGGGSIEEGQIELLIHRRLVGYDFYLFNKPLDEMAYGKGLVVRGTHTLFFEDSKEKKNSKQGSPTLRSLVLERSSQPQITFISMNFKSDQWIRFYRSKLQFLSKPLPENVKLLTFEPRPGSEEEYILRLEHIYDVDENCALSSPTEVSLKGLFQGFIIGEVRETTLDGNMMKSKLKKLNWKSADNDVDSKFKYSTPPASIDHIKLMPMEIRTFIIKLFNIS